MTSGIRFGKVLGVPVVADISAFVLALLFGGAVLIDLNQRDVASSTTVNGVVALLAGVAIVLSVVAHELSHAVVARRRGLAVREVHLFMFGGYSVIAGEPTALDELEVAAIGPVTSIGLGGLFAAGSLVFGDGSIAGSVLWSLMLANVAIGVFNLIPGFPLDGARILRNILTTKARDRVAATRVVTAVGRYTGWATIAVGIALLLGRQNVGVVLVIAGYFMATVAVTAGRREELSAAFDGVLVSDIMRVTPEAVSGDWTISTLLNLYDLGPRLRSLPVEIGGKVVGVIGQDEIDTVSPARWPSVRVRSLMVSIGPSDIVESTDPMESLLLRPAGESGRAIVVRDNEVVGVVDGASLAEVLRST
ncbi:MAG: site-2 protease family protein [Acidimicrobiia bacterium]|nr:MAG: site-2 protease family protein [Acidimicrobiia bacterium]